MSVELKPSLVRRLADNLARWVDGVVDDDGCQECGGQMLTEKHDTDPGHASWCPVPPACKLLAEAVNTRADDGAQRVNVAGAGIDEARAAVEFGAQRERAAVINWLQRQADSDAWEENGHCAWRCAISAIQRGEHVKEGVHE